MEEKKEKKTGFLKELDKSKKRQVLFFVVSMILLLLGYLVVMSLIKREKELEQVLRHEELKDFNVITSIDNIEYDSEKIIISGVACHISNENKDVFLVLQEEGGTGKLAYKAQKVDHNLSNTYKSEIIGEAGYVVSVPRQEIKKDICYKLSLHVSFYENIEGEENRVERYRQIPTNYFLCNGEVFVGVDKPDIKEAGFNRVISEGKLCFYLEEKNVWVYLHEGIMYWFMDANFIPKEENVPSIRLFMYTDQNSLIPEADIEKFKKEGYVYREFLLKEEHYCEETNYYIFEYKLPTEYPMTYIRTGVYKTKGDIGWAFRGAFTLNEMTISKE